jgi:hypothetical protein
MKRTMLIAGAMALALSVSGCGSDKANGKGEESDQQKQQDAQLAYSQCMRENGVTKFPDPTSDGGLMIKADSGIDPESSTFKAADEKCQSHLKGVMDAGSGPSPAEQQEQQEKLLAFAQCMRDNGVDMADPTFDGGRVMMKAGPGDGGAPSEVDKQKMDKAQAACRDKNPMPGGASNDSKGSSDGPSLSIGGSK